MYFIVHCVCGQCYASIDLLILGIEIRAVFLET